MAVLGAEYPTLVDVAKMTNPDGAIADVVDLLSKRNPMLMHCPWYEGNLPTGHRTTIQTGLPATAWRQFNQGVQPSKGTTAQVDYGMGMLEAYGVVDKDLANLNGNVAAFRMKRAQAFLSSMNNEMQRTFIYGDATVTSEEFTGFAAHTSAISGAANGEMVISGAGSDAADQTSIYLVGWGPNTVYGIYPKGSTAGIFHEDLGETLIQNANGVTGAMMKAYVDHWQWKAGLVVEDWRYLVRIPNIDVSNLRGESSPADIAKLMIRAINRIEDLNNCRPVFYINRTVRQMFEIQNLNYVRAAHITFDTVDGRRVGDFQGIPVETCDALLTTENQIT